MNENQLNENLLNVKSIVAQSRTEIVIYATKTTAGDRLKIEERVHQFTLSFSTIIYPNRRVKFYQWDGKTYFEWTNAHAHYLYGTVLIDVTEKFDEIIQSCDITSETKETNDQVGMNLFQLQEIVITPETKEYQEVKGKISVYNFRQVREEEFDVNEEFALDEELDLKDINDEFDEEFVMDEGEIEFVDEDETEFNNDYYEEDDDTIFHEVEQLIVIEQTDQTKRYFRLSYEEKSDSSGGYTYEITDEEEIKEALEKKEELMFETFGTFFMKNASYYSTSFVKDEESNFLLFVNKEGYSGEYLDKKGCEFELNQMGKFNKFKEYRIA